HLVMRWLSDQGEVLHYPALQRGGCCRGVGARNLGGEILSEPSGHHHDRFYLSFRHPELTQRGSHVVVVDLMCVDRMAECFREDMGDLRERQVFWAVNGLNVTAVPTLREQA